MDIGEHCDICGQLDFLPLKCRKCDQTFCGSHRMHDCKSDEPAPTPVEKKIPIRKPENTHNGKLSNQSTPLQAKKVEPNNTKSKKNAQKLNKTPAGPKPGGERAVAALERFKQLVGVPSKPKARASPVSLEMKRSSTGDASVPVLSRAYFNVSRPPQVYKDPLTNKDATRPRKVIAMYFDKTHTAGQLLDRASKQLGVQGKKLECAKDNVDLNTKISDLVQGSELDIIV